MSSKGRGIVPFNPNPKGKRGLIPARDLEDYRRRFETPMREVTLSEVASYYDSAEREFRRAPDKEKNALIPIIMSRLPAIVGKYNTMEQLRKRRGWDRQRKQIEKDISGALSFKEGFERLREMAEKHSFSADLKRMRGIKKVVMEDEETMLSTLNLTAEEVTWVSVLQAMPSTIFHDNLIHTTTILDYFYDGVEWGNDTLEGRDSDISRDTYQHVGLTGIRADTLFTPFQSKFQAALVMYYYHIIGDADIFQRIWEDVGHAAIMSGDGKLLRAFAARKRRNFTDQYALKARRIVNRWLGKLRLIHVMRGELLEPKEIVKLIGLLETAPTCLFEKRQMGFIPCGKGVMMVGPNLEELEYVPFDPYVAHIADTEIQRSAGSVDRKNRIWHYIFGRVGEAIRERNIQEENYAWIDEMAADMYLNYGIKVDLGVRKDFNKEVRKMWFGVEIEYTVKIGYWDMTLIQPILERFPPALLKAVKHLRRADFSWGMEEFEKGTRKWGDFNRETGAVSVSHPHVEDVSDEDEAQFQFGLAHEFGHGAWASEPRIASVWNKLSRAKRNFPIQKREGEFLTAYASTKREEDFADTVAAYLVCGDELANLAEKHPAIAAKRNFIQRLFGGPFPSLVKYSIEDLNGPITFDFTLQMRINDALGDSVVAQAYKRMHRRDWKSERAPKKGPQIQSIERKNERPGPEESFVDREQMIRRILVKRLGKKAKRVNAEQLDEIIWIGGLKDAGIAYVANRAPLALEKATELVEALIEGVQDYVSQIRALNDVLGDQTVGVDEDEDGEEEEEAEGEWEEEEEEEDYDDHE